MKKIVIGIAVAVAVMMAFAAPVFADPNPNYCYGQDIKAFNEPGANDSLGSFRSDKDWRLSQTASGKMSDIVAQRKANLGKPNPAP
jgi:hypothetical protein